MRSRTAAWVAWAGFALTAALFTFALVVASGSTPTFQPLAVHVQVWAIAFFGVTFLAFSAVGALVAARNAANAVGWLFLSLGGSVALALASIAYVETALPGRPWAEWLADLSSVSAFPETAFILLLFPDGKLPSAKWRVVAWTGVLTALAFVIGSFTPWSPPDYRFSNPVGIEGLRGTIFEEGALAWALLPITMLAAVASFVARFRGSSGPRRQQLKWFALAAGLVAAGLLSWFTTWGAIEMLVLSASSETVLTAAGIVVFVLCLMTIPVASGIAILRYRLYDIDVIINRTLVYGALTAALTSAYFVLVTTLQGLLRPLAGQSELAVAGSTLLVAALFRPARAHIQTLVDRRFYRSKFDAETILNSFSARLRAEVDLETVTGDLLAVVDRTMKPATLSLWLRRPTAVAAGVERGRPQETKAAFPPTSVGREPEPRANDA